MDKNELARKIQAATAFSDDEKAALLQLLRERKKYGLVGRKAGDDSRSFA